MPVKLYIQPEPRDDIDQFPGSKESGHLQLRDKAVAGASADEIDKRLRRGDEERRGLRRRDGAEQPPEQLVVEAILAVEADDRRPLRSGKAEARREPDA